MVDEDLQIVLSAAEGIGDVECPDGPAYEFTRMLMAVECYGGVSSDTLKLEEITLAVAFACLECFLI